jgi:hypothetical protein
MITPKVGQYLYASCSAEDYGRILAVGDDGNGTPTIDIELCHPGDAFSCDDDDTDFPNPVLTEVELQPAAKVILRKLQWRQLGECIVCNTPGNGCFRCTKCFWLHDEPAAEYLNRL